ncbi:DUF4326 domain-containing protein [Phaeodactylibacter xiamenensis]|uniref:DUF4326 domain-containing protein n=1 Tax=Phaeodactylibacter xiamenensis TaxID=1524460 RepID=UPI003CCC3AB7
MNRLNVKISGFPNHYQTEPKLVNLLTWLHSDKYKDAVLKLRATTDKEERKALKKNLPCITPSGIFTQREEDCLVEHSGLIQFDIDFQDNRNITNYQELKLQISRLPEVAYCGLSAGGNGYWGLIPLAYPSMHKAQFRALAEDFLKLGIVLDSAPKNVASLRAYSWDEDAYFNPEAVPYRRVKREVKETYQPSFHQEDTDEGKKVELCLQQIEKRGLDITAPYSDWFALGCSLANEFGENGRDYFHRVSQFYPRYSFREADRQYNHCKGKGYRYTISTFYYIAGLKGITYSEALKAERVLKPQSPQQPSPKKEPALPAGWQYEAWDNGHKILIDEDGLPAAWNLKPQSPQQERTIKAELKRLGLPEAEAGKLVEVFGLEVERTPARVVHQKKEPFDINIGRPSKWGNPFTFKPSQSSEAKYKVGTRAEAVEAYRQWITKGEGKHLLNDLHELEGKTLGCWCKPYACHGDVLVELLKYGIPK